MKIFDRGTFDVHKWRDKEVMVTFHGERVAIQQMVRPQEAAQKLELAREEARRNPVRLHRERSLLCPAPAVDGRVDRGHVPTP